jgi:hypothetical protein
MSEETSQHIPATVVAVDQSSVVVACVDGQQISFPRNYFATECAVGTAVQLRVTTAATDEQEREHLAKTILNQLLKP